MNTTMLGASARRCAPAALAAMLVLSASGLAMAAESVSGNSTSAEELGEVVVTGSRVIRNGNDSPTPVTVVTIEDIQATRPTTVFEGLLDMPSFAGSRTTTTNPGNASGRNNNINALSLRGLGQQRTLVLYDGHRVPPTQEDGFVNVNMIPQMLLQRVDVVTGGVSAVYGSDGISGVVNFITDRKFNGVKVNAQYGVSGQSDGRAKELGIAAGMDLFGGRGHIQGSFQARDDDGVPLKTMRQFGRERWTLQGSGTAALPSFLVPFATNSALPFGGRINGPATGSGGANPLLGQHFVAPGVLGAFNSGSTVGVTGNIQIGGDGGYDTSTTLKAALALQQLYGRFDFDVSDNLHFYLTGSGTVEHLFVNNTDNNLNNVSISSTNAFLSPAHSTALTARGIQNFTFGKMWNLTNGVGPNTADDYTRQWLVNTGLEGKLGAYRWEGWYTHGVARQDNRNNHAIHNGRLAAALDAVRDTSGNIVCRVTITNPTLYPGCVPMNVFGVGSESAQSVAYVTQIAQFQPETTMDNVAGSITGAPFNSWAGPINMALSGEWRRTEYQLVSNSLPVLFDPLSCTGLTGTGLPGNCTNFNAATGVGTARVSTSVANRPPVSQSVREAAIEADIPLLKDRPFVQRLNVNTAYRYAHYSATGSPVITQANTTTTFSANTWKAGLDWQINDRVRIRATRSRDFRAPNLVDLYAPASITIDNMVDLLTNLNPINGQLQSGGNPTLQPETGDTTTLGFVIRPTPSFSLSVDGYDIKISDAIINASGRGPAAQQACNDSRGTSFYCTLIERPVSWAEANANRTQANTITKYYSRPVNAAVQKSWGIDTEANWNTQIRGHLFTLRGLLTYQPHAILDVADQRQDFAGVDFSNNNQGGAVWRATAFARYGVNERFFIDWSTRYRSALHHNSTATEVVGRGDPNHIPSVMFSNLNLSYNLGGSFWQQATVYLNVQNVADQTPPPTAGAGPPARPGNFGGWAPGDDPIGRYFTLGLRARL
jgi:outer membrane receptor protein involved in Fe transport